MGDVFGKFWKVFGDCLEGVISTCSGPRNGPAGAYTNFFNAYVDPVMFARSADTPDFSQGYRPYISYSQIVPELLNEMEFRALLAQAVYWGSPTLETGVEAVGGLVVHRLIR